MLPLRRYISVLILVSNIKRNVLHQFVLRRTLPLSGLQWKSVDHGSYDILRSMQLLEHIS